jgi:CubicO group peptidase (beta-lactamase class C family)
VAVARRGEVLYRAGFGVADFSSLRPMALNDQFQLASVSKQFTAMAVMMLAQRGLLSYDDLYVSHVSDFPYADVTIRHLLQHTAGMPDYMSLMERCWKNETLPDNEDLLSALIQYKPTLYFTPGRRFDYSNTGYALLALLVKRLSQGPFETFLEEEIFVPLGMWDTYVYSPSRQVKGERQLSGHHRYHRRWEPTPDTLHEDVLGDKGIYSTVDDMLKWDRALHQGILVPEDRLAEAFLPLTLKNGRHWKYGFGFRIEDNPQQHVVFHYGRWNSFSTCIFRDLDSEYTLIMLSNIKRSLDPLQKRIRAILPTWETTTPSMEMVLDNLKSALLSTLGR